MEHGRPPHGLREPGTELRGGEELRIDHSPSTSRRRSRNVALACDTTRSSSPRTTLSTYAICRVSWVTSPSTRSESPALAARRVWYCTSRVAARSPRSSALFTAKFIAASWITPYTPPCTMPAGLQANSVGLHAAADQPSP